MSVGESRCMVQGEQHRCSVSLAHLRCSIRKGPSGDRAFSALVMSRSVARMCSLVACLRPSPPQILGKWSASVWNPRAYPWSLLIACLVAASSFVKRSLVGGFDSGAYESLEFIRELQSSVANPEVGGSDWIVSRRALETVMFWRVRSSV